MKFRLHSLFTMEEMRPRSQPIKALGIFVVYADIVGECVTPCPHLRGSHHEIECAFLPLQHLAQFALAGLLNGGGRVNDNRALLLRRRAKYALLLQIYDFQTGTIPQLIHTKSYFEAHRSNFASFPKE